MAAMKEWRECGYIEQLKKLDTYVAAQCSPAGFVVGDQVLCRLCTMIWSGQVINTVQNL